MKAVALCAVLAACIGLTFQRGGMVTSISEEVPPRFSFGGGTRDHVRHLPFFFVNEVPVENQKLRWMEPPRKENKTIWRIAPKTGAAGELKNLPVITYGQLPHGFVQEVPKQGEAPGLEEGKVYDAGGPAVMVPCTYIRFTIRDGKAVRLSIPGKDDSANCKSY